MSNSQTILGFSTNHELVGSYYDGYSDIQITAREIVELGAIFSLVRCGNETRLLTHICTPDQYKNALKNISDPAISTDPTAQDYMEAMNQLDLLKNAPEFYLFAHEAMELLIGWYLAQCTKRAD